MLRGIGFSGTPATEEACSPGTAGASLSTDGTSPSSRGAVLGWRLGGVVMPALGGGAGVGAEEACLGRAFGNGAGCAARPPPLLSEGGALAAPAADPALAPAAAPTGSSLEPQAEEAATTCVATAPFRSW